MFNHLMIMVFFHTGALLPLLIRAMDSEQMRDLFRVLFKYSFCFCHPCFKQVIHFINQPRGDKCDLKKKKSKNHFSFLSELLFRV